MGRLGPGITLASSQPDRAKELHLMLDNWRKSVNAVMPAPNPKYDPATPAQGLTGTEPCDP